MKRVLMIGVLMLSTVFAASLVAGAKSEPQEPQDPQQETAAAGLPTSTWKRGLAIAPVPLNFEGKNRKLVGEGSYLVNARASCVGCHTEPTYALGGDPFRGQPEQINTANYLAGGAQFGPFTSANITPDLQTGLPAGLTYDQFVASLRVGKDFKNRHPQFGPLLQVMPWPEFSKLTDDDLSAIYEYLRAIPHAEPAPPTN